MNFQPPDSGIPAYRLSTEAVLRRHQVNADQGLDERTARQRLAEFGQNRLLEHKPLPALSLLLSQFASAVVLLLVVAAIVSAIFGEWIEALAIAIVLAINTAIGFFTEIRAVRSMEALRRLGIQKTRVRRAGRTRIIDAEDLVPGDIVVLEAGDLVPADLRLIRMANLASNEAALTGESLPVDKSVEEIAGTALLHERRNMLFKATAVARGTAVGVVTATGRATEIGHISRLVEETEKDRSPLERQLERLSRQLVWVTLSLVLMIILAGIYSGKDTLLMAKAGIALAVAAIPEGLPIVATLVLARGMLRLARQHALVEHLPAVEILGSTTVILTDKTGTLTENRMVVEQFVLPDGEWLVDRDRNRIRHGQQAPEFPGLFERSLCVGVLCSNATLDPDQPSGIGDPTEIALLQAAALAGMTREKLLLDYPLAAEYAFDSQTKCMATIHAHAGVFLVAVKGAPETILPICSHIAGMRGDVLLAPKDIDDWMQKSDQYASRGLRLIALAAKEAEDLTGSPFTGLTFLGLAAIHDPPRSDIPAAIGACRAAGISVVMVTGDHAGTAHSVSAAVGLSEADDKTITGHDLTDFDGDDHMQGDRLRKATVFARVSPEQKLDLIRLHQSAGEIVAMTGDGVNDAPALRQADIGIAMGVRGTQVAKEAADVVLQDDAFSSIVSAIREGRIIFGNIRQFAGYLLSCNLSEVLIVGLAVLAGLPLPVLPLQILFLNLVTDVFPAFALGLGEGDADVLERPPRSPKEPILARRHWIRIVLFGLSITAATLGALMIALYGLGLPNEEAVTVSFLTLALAQLWHVFNMRNPAFPPWRNDIVRNPYIWGALAFCIFLLALSVLVPSMASVLSVTSLDWPGWVLIILASLAPVLLVEICRLLHRVSTEKTQTPPPSF